MNGIRNGMQALVKKEADHCLYVHCFDHSLNLCVQDVTKKCDLLRNTMEFIFQLVQLIKFSPKRLNLFESVHQEVALSDCGGEGGSVYFGIIRFPFCDTKRIVKKGERVSKSVLCANATKRIVAFPVRNSTIRFVPR